ncbi:MAG: hypothetical protein E7632_07375 [Ruminococcaceae bacterium]|nr:hypothetical protein [Oscillospiraceae bacterium]
MGKGRNHTEKFTFQSLPANVEELKALPEAKLDTAFKTTALVILALNRYEADPDACIAMLSFLKGPEEFGGKEQSFLKDRMADKGYKARSFLGGATPANNYTPAEPYTVAVSENPYSFDEENWATMYVTSGGADNPRPIKLRKKPSTGEWFLCDIQCLADIRIPAAEDKWA